MTLARLDVSRESARGSTDIEARYFTDERQAGPSIK